MVWWTATLAFMAVSLVWVRSVRTVSNRSVTLAAFCTAAVFAIFQIEIPLFGGIHLSLTPLTGILVGPALGTLVVLIVNILSAAVGHGGWGLIGANTLVSITEVITAYSVWRILARVLSGGFARAGIATITALLCGNLVMIGIIVVSGVQGSVQGASSILAALALLAAVNMGVAVIEAFITGMIITSVMKTRPDILDLR